MDLFEQKGIKPMLIKEMNAPFNSPDWIYELKLDGIRCIAYLDKEGTDLRNKRDMLLLPRFPELKDINKQVRVKCILDGEVVILKNKVPDFYEIQRRTMITDKFKTQLAMNKLPANFVAYDILYHNGENTNYMPLIKRKELLESVVNENNRISVSRYVKEYGVQLFDLTVQQKLEGVVAKRIDSKYFFDKRTSDWIKFKSMKDEDFVVCGYVTKESKNTTLILGQYKGEQLIYKGSVSFGVKHDFFDEYHCTKADYSPFTLTPMNNEDVTWIKPDIVCVVEYMPNTKDALRQPVFKGIRDDVLPIECQVKT